MPARTMSSTLDFDLLTICILGSILESSLKKGGGPVKYMSTGSNLYTREVADC